MKRLLILLLIVLPPRIPAQTGAPIIRYDSIHHPVIGRGGMVVSQNALASEVGRDILAQGGNAVDAAVAVGFALAVTLPRAGNLGGSGFMLVYEADSGETHALDFRSAAPAAATIDEFRDEQGELDYGLLTFGPKAPAVPGTVAGLEHAWREYGSMPWAQLLEPALALAEQGIIVSDDLAYALEQAMTVMRNYPEGAAAYLKADGALYQPGELLRQPDLAWSIRQLGEHGADAFYRGAIAEKIVDYMERAGGYISAADLAAYQVRETAPLSVNYRGHTISTMPPSSGGGIAMLQMFNVLSHFNLAAMPQGGAASIHVLAETMKRVNANRRQGLGDPGYVDVPVAGFLSAELAAEIAAGIRLDRARPVSEIEPMDAWSYALPRESRDTTHYSIVDGEGNAVSLTYTLGYSFGSGVVAPGTGILLDNQMRNYSLREPGHANGLEAGKRMLSTMSPTLVFAPDGRLLLVTGTPGGSRIHTSLLQLIVNVIDYGRNVAEATHLPRIYQAWRSPELGVEQGVAADTRALLQELGHAVEQQQTMGSTQTIMLVDDVLHGAADPRRPGALALPVR